MRKLLAIAALAALGVSSAAAQSSMWTAELGVQGGFAKVPGLGAFYGALTRVLPLRRGQVLERSGCLFVR